MKKCKQCGKLLPTSTKYFNLGSSSNKYGLTTRCKKCINPIIEKKCLGCGGIFKTNNKNKLYCCGICARITRKTKSNPNYIYQKPRELTKEEKQESKRRQRRNRKKIRRIEDQNYRIRLNLRKRLADLVHAKSYSFSKMINLSGSDLKTYLELMFINNMNWDNYGKYWHIDHIIPCSVYDLTIEDEAKKCFNYRNLRPLEANENIKKSDVLDMGLVYGYGIEDLLPHGLDEK